VTPVSLHVWRAGVPGALWHMAVGRARLRKTPGVRFAKLLGTGKGFGLGSADPTRWATLVAWEPGTTPAPVLIGTPYTAQNVHKGTLLSLAPLGSRGTWSGRAPFEPMSAEAARAHDGPILVLTRARLRLAKAGTFWRSIGPVARTLPEQPGLLAAFGVGEAPLGFQGTVSVWRSAADIAEFAYRRPQHAAVVSRTGPERWYAEELFARFAVLDVTGDREVIGWKTSP
jgi:hypothetical protein